MNWLERYVAAVKSYLPKKTREDVGDEIRSAMQDKLEAEEGKLGRKMKDTEMKKWLEGQDHPMVLASGFQERRELVSAEIYPLYLVALKIAIIIIIGINVLSAGLYILGGGEFTFSGIFSRLFGGLFGNGLLAFASITLVFHFLGKYIAKGKFYEKWKVENLPESGHKWLAVSVGEKIFEIVVYIFVLGWLNTTFVGRWAILGSDAVSLNPDVYQFLPWINALLLLSIYQNIWLVVRPHWNVTKLAFNTALAAFAVALAAMILTIDPIVTFDPAFVAEHPNVDGGGWVNRTVRFSIYVIGAIALYEVIRDLYRIIKLRK